MYKLDQQLFRRSIIRAEEFDMNEFQFADDVALLVHRYSNLQPHHVIELKRIIIREISFCYSQSWIVS